MRKEDVRSDAWFSLLVTLGFLVGSFAISLELSRVVPTVHGWVYSGDLFATLRDSHMILWGGYGILYSSGNGLIAPPLGALSLAPLAALSSLLGLVEPYPQPFPEPTIWLYALGYMGIFSFAWTFSAKRLLRSVAPEARHAKFVVACSSAVAAYMLFPWGHPEDIAAIALCFFAFTAFHRKSFHVGAYLAGFAVGFQPLALLFLLPMFLIFLPNVKRLAAAAARAAVVPAALLAPAFIAAPSQSIDAWLHQPNFPKVDHLTIWGYALGQGGKILDAGQLRIAMLAVIVLASVVFRVIHRRKPLQTRQILVICALGLSMRGFFEPVIVAYYLAPFLAAVVLLVPRDDQKPQLVASALALLGLGIIGTASIHTSPVTYSVDIWSLNLGLVLLMVFAYQSAAGKRDSKLSGPIGVPDATVENVVGSALAGFPPAQGIQAMRDAPGTLGADVVAR